MDCGEEVNAPEIVLSEIMERWPQTICIFLKYKLMCVGCEISRFHTVRDACAEHDISEEAFRRELAQATSRR